MPPKQDPTAIATLEAAEATQLAVEAQTDKIEEQNVLLREVGDSIKGLVDLLSQKLNIAPQMDIPPIPVPTRVVAPATQPDAQTATAGVQQPSAGVQLLQPTVVQGNANTIPPHIQQPATDLLMFTPAGRQGSTDQTTNQGTMQQQPATGVPIQQPALPTPQLGVPNQHQSGVQIQQAQGGVPIQQQTIVQQQITDRSTGLHQMAPRDSASQYINHYIQAGATHIPDTSGEPFKGNTNAISHPYMFVERYEIKDNDYSKKFQIRNTISFEEYTHAYMKMLTLTTLPYPIAGPLCYHLEHIKEIAQLAQQKPWEFVRFWSMYLFDSIENGTISWEDTQKVQSEKARVIELAEHLTNKNVQLCKAFQVGTCEKQYWDITSHIVELSTQKHLCAYCYKNDKAENNHPEFKCRIKKGLNIKKGQRDYPYNGNQNYQQPLQNNNYRGQNQGNTRFANPNMYQQGFQHINQDQPRFQFQHPQIQPLNPNAQNFNPQAKN